MQRSVYRIIDANFNRAREAVRVIEEFCRFALNSSSLTERTKQLRHQLCAAGLGRPDIVQVVRPGKYQAADVGPGLHALEELRGSVRGRRGSDRGTHELTHRGDWRHDRDDGGRHSCGLRPRTLWRTTQVGHPVLDHSESE